MCEPISIGIAIGAATGAISSAVTGGDVLQGALMGGVMGGIGGAFLPPAPGLFGSPFTTGMASNVGGFLGASTVFNSAIGMSAAQAVGMGAMGLTGGLAMGMLAPGTPEYYNYQQQLYTPNSQPSTVTGSGGKQAAFSLAESVRRAKKRKLTQEDVSDLSIDTSSFASEGLQFA